jgi:NADH-quinone oxidoreductase subunit N
MTASLAMPEIFLATAGLLLLIYGVVRGDRSAGSTAVLTIWAFMLAAIMMILHPAVGLAFHDMFVNDAFARFVKFALLLASGLSVAMASASPGKLGLAKPEYPLLILFAMLGMMMMVSSNDLMALYAGLELQSLSLYVLTAFRRDDAKASEAGLKYFVLGALASGILLYGISMLYGYAGSTNFTALASAVTGTTKIPAGVTLGLVFVCAGLAFKIAAVPFHMWAPDVYEGAPTPVTAFFAAAPKLAAMALLTRVLMQPFGGVIHQWNAIIMFLAVASMLLGSFAGLAQSNIKRLMAYSAIAHAGTALVGLAAGDQAGVQAVLIYVALYIIAALGVFGVILCLRRRGEEIEKITDLAGLSKTRPMLALAMALFMFSLAGVPPMAGFFGKYFVFLAAVKAGMIPLAIIGVLCSVVATAYYLRIVKVMYFDEPAEEILDEASALSLRVVTAAMALAVVLFVFAPAPLVDAALNAARSLVHV